MLQTAEWARSRVEIDLLIPVDFGVLAYRGLHLALQAVIRCSEVHSAIEATTKNDQVWFL